MIIRNKTVPVTCFLSVVLLVRLGLGLRLGLLLLLLHLLHVEEIADILHGQLVHGLHLLTDLDIYALAIARFFRYSNRV